MRQNNYFKLIACILFLFAPLLGFAQKGAASLKELSQNLHQAIKANNPTILTKYYPSTAVLNEVREQGTNDLRELLADRNAQQVAAMFEADFNELMKLDLAEKWYLAKTSMKETEPVQIKLKEGSLMPVEMILQDKEGREFSVYYQALRNNDRFYYFRNMKVERIGYKYRPNAALNNNTPVKGKIIRGAASIPELGQALFTALKAQDAEMLNLYIPEQLEMDYLRQQGTGPTKAVADSFNADQIKRALKQDFQRILTDGKGSRVNWDNIELKEIEVVLPSIKDGSMKILRIIVQEPEGKETGVVFESIKTKDRHYLFRNMRISEGNAPW